MKIIKIEFLNCEIGFFTKRQDLIDVAESKGIYDIAEHATDVSTNGLAIKSTGADGLPYFFLAVFNRNIQTLVHESVHIVDYLLDRHGIPIDIANTETRAYLTDYIFSKALQYGKFKRI